MTEQVVSVNELAKIYGELIAENHISIDLDLTEIFALIGPNSAGAVPLHIQMIAKVFPPSYFIDGRKGTMMLQNQIRVICDMAITGVLSSGFLKIEKAVTKWREK